MYLYFDKNGVLLEVINDEALRQYNHQVNTIYVYVENSPTTEFVEKDGYVLKYLQYWFERPNGDNTEVYSTDSHAGDAVVTETIPPNAKRDLNKFQYGVPYKMHKILMPSGRELADGEYEYNIFEDAGPVSLSIKAVFEDNIKELTLGKVVFTIEDEVVVPSNKVSVSQFEFLLRAVDTAITQGRDYNNLINKPQINGVELRGNKTANDLGLVPQRLNLFPKTEKVNSAFRLRSNVYVDDGENGYKMSLADIKDMNTKIIAVSTASEVDTTKLVAGDYICIKKQD